MGVNRAQIGCLQRRKRPLGLETTLNIVWRWMPPKQEEEERWTQGEVHRRTQGSVQVDAEHRGVSCQLAGAGQQGGLRAKVLWRQAGDYGLWRRELLLKSVQWGLHGNVGGYRQ